MQNVVQALSEYRGHAQKSIDAAKIICTASSKTYGSKTAGHLTALQSAGFTPVQLIEVAGYTKEQCVAAGAKKCTFLHCVRHSS